MQPSLVSRFKLILLMVVALIFVFPTIDVVAGLRGPKPKTVEEKVEPYPIWNIDTSVAVVSPSGGIVVRATVPKDKLSAGADQGAGGFMKAAGKSLFNGSKASVKSGDTTVASAEAQGPQLISQWKEAVGLLPEVRQGHTKEWNEHYPGGVQAISTKGNVWVGADRFTDFRTATFSPDGRYVAVGGHLSEDFLSLIGFSSTVGAPLSVNQDCHGNTHYVVEPSAQDNYLFQEGDLEKVTFQDSHPTQEGCVAVTKTRLSQQFFDRMRGNIAVFDLKAQDKQLATIPFPTATHLYFTADGSLRAIIATKGGGAAYVDVWNTSDASKGYQMVEIEGSVNQMNCLVKDVAQMDYERRYWATPANGKFIAAIQFKDTAFSRKQFDLVVCDSDGEEIDVIKIGNDYPVYDMVFSRDGKRLALVGDEYLRVFNVTKSGIEEQAMDVSVMEDFAISTADLGPSGKQLIIADVENNYKLLDVEKGGAVIDKGELDAYASPLHLDDGWVSYLSGTKFVVVDTKLPK